MICCCSGKEDNAAFERQEEEYTAFPTTEVLSLKACEDDGNCMPPSDAAGTEEVEEGVPAPPADQLTEVSAPCDEDASMFIVNISKTKKDIIGVEVDLNALGCLKIVKVKAGIFETWNQANPSKCVTAGCNIKEINGKTGDPKALLAEIKASSTLVIKVEREALSPRKDEVGKK